MQPELASEVSESGSVPKIHLVEHIGEVRTDGAGGDIELGADFLVAESTRHKPYDLQLPTRQAIKPGRAAPRRHSRAQ